jgi:Zn-dependent protease with chaperone function
MHLLVYVPLLAPVLAAVCARPLADRLHPAAATWLLTLSALTLAAASCAMLGLIALAAALRLPAVAAAGGLSRRAVSRIDPASLPLGVIAASLLAVAAMAAVHAAWRRTAAIARAHREARHLSGAGNVVIIEDERVDAYAAPGWPGRVVVTSGMLAALSDRERDVLLAHEGAHATGRHYLFTGAVRLASAANPLLRPVSAAVSYSVERWADEQAARAVGNRELAARTVAKAALAASARPPWRRPPAVLAAVPRQFTDRRSGAVPRRVGALLLPAPRRNLLLPAMAAVVLVASAAAVIGVAGDVHAMIELAQAAWSR